MSEVIVKPDLLLGLEVRHLVALDAIARTRSFSQAAADLGYAQSAISQQIATLERVVGQRLVERPGGPRPVSLTDAGAVLLRHAEHITARLGAVRADLEALACGEAGTLRVGTFQSASTRLLPPVLAAFRRNWPHVDVTLHNTSTIKELETLVRSGQIDLAFSDVTTFPEGLAARELIDDPYIAIVAPESPLAHLEALDLAQLDGADMIAFSPQDSCAMRVGRSFASVHATPRIVFRTDDNLTTQRLVANGIGAAVQPRLAVETGVGDADVVMLPLTSRCAFSRRIGIIWHPDRHRSPAAEALIDTAHTISTALATSLEAAASRGANDHERTAPAPRTVTA